MLSCYQFDGMNMLEHGIDVHDWYVDLYNHLKNGAELYHEWKLPEWVYSKVFIFSLLDYDFIALYHIYHDCGKPFCRVVDENGNQHFPNHAEVSKQRWLECANKSVLAQQVANLIGLDMKVHEGTLDIDCPQALWLIATALCEIHSNCYASGNTIESTNFKIKFKRIDKLGKATVKRNTF